MAMNYTTELTVELKLPTNAKEYLTMMSPEYDWGATKLANCVGHVSYMNDVYFSKWSWHNEIQHPKDKQASKQRG